MGSATGPTRRQRGRDPGEILGPPQRSGRIAAAARQGAARKPRTDAGEWLAGGKRSLPQSEQGGTAHALAQGGHRCKQHEPREGNKHRQLALQALQGTCAAMQPLPA